MIPVLKYARTLALLAVTGLPCFALAAPMRPNIVLMMADDLGWGDVQCFRAQSPIHTPHLDAMAASGMRFTRFYAAAPVCSPTRGSCLTGRHPYRYGVYGANKGHLKAEERTLAELLKHHGYATGHFGKWHLGTLTTTLRDSNRGRPGSKQHFSPPQANGFDICFSTEAKVPTYDPMLRPAGRGRQRTWDFIRDKPSAAAYGTHYWDERGEVVTGNLEGDDSRVIMDRVLPFVRNATHRQQPFFAVIWFHAPHLPVVAGPKHAERYAQYDTYAKNYYGCVTALDEQAGRLRRSLQELGIADNTLVWFGSDNGPEGKAGSAPGSAGPFRGRKRSLYEGGIRVPGIVEWPGQIKAGSVTDVPAVTSDYLPTILDMLGIAPVDDRPLDGTSLLPLLQGRMQTRPTPIGFQSHNQMALVTERYKLYSSNAGKTWELYDLVHDPSEKVDISGQHGETVESLRRQLEAWRESCARSDREQDYNVPRSSP